MGIEKKRILLVEDEAIIAMQEKLQLEKLGYSVDHAPSGEAAVAMATDEGRGFDAVLMDIDLGGGMDGTQAAEAMLKTGDIPIVFLSSHAEPGIVAKTERITSYGYVVKNSGIVILDASIKMALRLFDEKVERAQAEHQVLRIKSLYATLSRINKVIVRIGALEELAAEVSRVAVQLGLFKFAWVGRYDGKTAAVSPLGYAGEPESIVRGVRHGSDEAAGRPCLCGQAIARGGPNVVNDLAADAECLGRMSEIMEAGIEAAAVFPILARGEVWGVFGVYADEAGIFQEEEIALLGEAAMDLGYAVENIENEARRRQAEKFQHLSTEVLGVLNEPLSLHESSRAILKLIREATGLDAVGIRLKDNDDFPYFSEEGFEEEFLLAENSLIHRGDGGLVCRDEDGRICLECSCGLVLSEKCGQPSDNVTPAGSLWTNDSLATLEALRRGDPRLEPRDRCSHDGFLSVALIPIRADGRIVGLLHLNDRRRDRFSPEAIRFFEGLTASFGITVERKRSEERLRESEARYRLIADNTADVIWVLNPATGTFTYVSPSVERLRGYTPEEVMALPASCALTPDSAELVARKIAATLPAFLERGRGTASSIDEVDQPRKDGSVVRTEVTTNYLLNEAGEVEIVGVTRDITGRKRMEAQLRRSEERFRLALAHAPVSVAIQDLDLRFTWAYNQRTRRAEEIVGATDRDLFPQDADRLIALKRRALETGQCTNERLWITSNGRRLYLDIYVEPLRDEGGEVEGLGIATVDLTDIKRAEDRLQASEARFRAVFDNAPVGISILDSDLRSLESNGMLEVITRAGRGNPAAGPSQGRRYIREDGTEIPPGERAGSRAIAEGAAVRGLVGGIVMEDGEVVWTQVSAAPLGQPETGVVVITEDITERKRAEEEDRRQLLEKEILLKEVHHRLKNNIASIEGLLNIQAQSSGDEEVKSALHESISRVQSIRILYEKLLPSDDYQVVATAAYIESLIASIVALFPARQSVAMELNVADFPLKSKAMMSVGIIINELITNIFKHAFEGREGGRVRLDFTRADGLVRLAIRDDGIGAMEGLDSAKSVGFGLTIVKMLVQQLDGSFSMRNDGGTESILEFRA